MVSRPAGFWVRLGALLIDAIFMAIILLPVVIFMRFSDDQTQLLSTLIEIAYSVMLPLTWVGYTIGKRALGIRIVKVKGENVTISSMLLREVVGRVVYIITFGIGLIVSIILIVVREDKRALHDLIAGTYVTYNKPEEINPYQDK